MVPLCLLCSVIGVLWTHNSVNIFVQIGLVVLVGLACKNSILIVEFAKRLRQEGRPRREAAQEASRLRLRPILMTSLAFILGVVPLVFASGAGAEMRRSLGTAVFSGMLGVTLFGIFLTPVFFYVIGGLGETAAVPVRRRAAHRLRRCSAGSSGLASAMLVEDLSPRSAFRGESSAAARASSRTMVAENSPAHGHVDFQGHAGHQRERRSIAMISHFFIDRPIFASVLSIVFVLAGGVAVFNLPMAQYPEVTPPMVVVTAIYPGANAQTVRDTVAAPIEEQVSGVEGMIYMSSQCTNDGDLPAGGHLQAGHGFRHGPSAGAEPRVAGAAGHSAVGPERGHRGQEGLAEHVDDREPDLDGRPLRQHLPQQLRHDLPPRRAGPPARRGRRHLFRPARLQPPRLARPQ